MGYLLQDWLIAFHALIGGCKAHFLTSRAQLGLSHSILIAFKGQALAHLAQL
jgi:hypothetical protein